MVVNFRAHGISRDASKLTWIPTLIIIIIIIIINYTHTVHKCLRGSMENQAARFYLPLF